MSPTAAFLADRGVVRVEGEDAPDFLQGHADQRRRSASPQAKRVTRRC